jgi:hypothetical protein
MARLIALYLPQFHPTSQNDIWWGKGFTEWTNVARARSLFPGHKQPHIPADLGFYDLRLPIIREQQAKMAQEAGIEGFCYWHYWFGNNNQMLEKPFKDVIESGEPDFPFCLAWANHSWQKKKWDKNGTSELLIEQNYYGEKDYLEHFNSLLPAFKDKRYIKVNGKLFFEIYCPLDFPDAVNFIKIWRRLAKENNLNDFYFVGEDTNCLQKEKILNLGFDAISNNNITSIHIQSNNFIKGMRWIGREWFKIPSVYKYKNAINYMVTDDCKCNDVIPMIAPNWDHSPRSGGKAVILHKSTPEYFGRVVQMAINAVKEKPEDEQIILIKSWNEWGEGNYLEPDLEFGLKYLEVLKNNIK